MSIRKFETPTSVTLTSTKENFMITIDTEKDGEILELSQITLHLLGRTWHGTIQDVAAIHDYAKNAYNRIYQYGYFEELEELRQLLSHFGTTVAPIPQTPDRCEEIAVISAIITRNFFDEILKSLATGATETYYAIAKMATDFFEKYKHHTDWETPPASFVGATGWEDCICMFVSAQLTILIS